MFPFRDVLNPKSSQGNHNFQPGEVHGAVRAVLSVQCAHSTIPIAARMYGTVWRRVVPKIWVREDQSCKVNGMPQSEVICSGTLNLLIHSERRASSQDDADASVMGIALNHLTNLLMVVERYLAPSEGRRSPTMLTWMWPNLWKGEWNWSVLEFMCLITLLALQECIPLPNVWQC